MVLYNRLGIVKRLAVIVVHGGAGFWPRDAKHLRRGLSGVSASAKTGMNELMNGRTALDAVEAAVASMEDNPMFNAGRGSSLTFSGTVEMDAAIMDGGDLSAGAVAMLRDLKNPIHLARIVMESTDHVLIAGRTAMNLANEFDLPRCNPITAERKRIYLRLKKELKDHPTRNSDFLQTHPDLLTDTVGAVSLDECGNFAAAASTGGVALKMPGRIGDTPQIGSGLYADNRAGAVAATGVGEVAIKLVISKTICDMMRHGVSASRACASAVASATHKLGGQAGVIAIDRRGRVAAIHNTPFMPCAYATSRMRTPKVSSRGIIVAPLALSQTLQVKH